MNRRIAAQICWNTYEGSMKDYDSNSGGSSDASSFKPSEQVEAIVKWLEDIKGSTSAIPDKTANDDGSEYQTVDKTANDDDGEEHLISGHKILLESEAYRWLISVMQRTARLNGIDPNCMIGHRENIDRQLQSITAKEAQKQRIHRLVTSKRPPPRYIARFSLSWDLLNFLREEYEGERPAEVIGQVVALTGDAHSVQAATCRGYLEQVWPTTGSEFMDLVEDMIARPGQSCKRMLPVSYFSTLMHN